MENTPLSPRAPLSPVGRLTACGKLAFGHLPTALGKPLRGFPQAPSFDDDPSLLSMHISNCRHRTKRVDAEHQAMRLFLACSRHLALGLAHVLSRWWRHGDPVRAGFAEYMAARTELEKQRVINQTVRAKLARFPARQRKHYLPEERFRILELRHSYGISLRETAAAFLVDPQTIARWERKAATEPDTETVGTLVRATPNECQAQRF